MIKDGIQASAGHPSDLDSALSDEVLDRSRTERLTMLTSGCAISPELLPHGADRD